MLFFIFLCTFDLVDDDKISTSKSSSPRLSYIEIYNDVIIDLLDETPKTIKIREDTAGAIHLNVEEKVINSPRQAYDIIEMGEKRRKYGITQANQRSSRSHTIFRIVSRYVCNFKP